MTNKPGRFVCDTNVIIRAILSRESVHRQVLIKLQREGGLLVSAPLVEELNDVFHREKFNRYVPLEGRLRFLVALLKNAEEVAITEAIAVCRDPKDDKILELAVNGGASCIISSDQDLLSLSPFQNIPIYTPVEFLEQTWDDEK